MCVGYTYNTQALPACTQTWVMFGFRVQLDLMSQQFEENLSKLLRFSRKVGHLRATDIFNPGKLQVSNQGIWAQPVQEPFSYFLTLSGAEEGKWQPLQLSGTGLSRLMTQSPAGELSSCLISDSFVKTSRAVDPDKEHWEPLPWAGLRKKKNHYWRIIILYVLNKTSRTFQSRYSFWNLQLLNSVCIQDECKHQDHQEKCMTSAQLFYVVWLFYDALSGHTLCED